MVLWKKTPKPKPKPDGSQCLFFFSFRKDFNQHNHFPAEFCFDRRSLRINLFQGLLLRRCFDRKLLFPWSLTCSVSPDTAGPPPTEHPSRTALPGAQPARSACGSREGRVPGIIPAFHKMGINNKKLEIPLCTAGNISLPASFMDGCEAR